MSTQKLSSSSFKHRVTRTWMTKIGSAWDPFRLPDIRAIEAEQLPLLFGRDRGPRDGTYLIDDPSVSTRHAALRFRENRFELVELGSTNGTFVNGTRLHENAPHPLRDGDLIQMAGTFFRFRTGGFNEYALPKTPSSAGYLASVCPEFIETVAVLRTGALTDVPVLIRGETGTGKEVFARTLHDLSKRSGKYVPINTAGIQPGLVPAELFGVVKGAHSGAENERDGLIRSAEGGTVLLDEIGDMPLEMQPALLRTLQEFTVTPVGSDEQIPIDVRFIAATHRDPEDRAFLRDDLVARLSGITIQIPPLRERIEDLGLLIGTILRELSADHVQFAADAYARLVLYHWPRNIRQLRHALQRAAVSDEEVTVEALDAAGVGRPVPADDGENLETPSPEYIRMLLREHSGNITSVAVALGMHRMRLNRLLKREAIDPNAFRARPRSTI